jgi:Sulfotransferase family
MGTAGAQPTKFWTARRTMPPGGLTDPKTAGDWSRLYLRSVLDSRHNPDLGDLANFTFFIGYARSGHTLIGTMLNAHPEVVIAHELDALRFVRRGFTRSQLYALLLRRDQQFGSIGRTWSGYQYDIPDQYQGRFERLRVLGDKRARSSVLQIAEDPRLLDRLRTRVRVPIRVIHVTRNPFDNIATEARRHKMSLSDATRWYRQICEAVRVVRPLLDPSELLDLPYENFVGDAAASLANLCRFIDVEAPPSYLEACAGIVWPSANRTRDAVDWTPEERAGVERLIEQYEVLAAYTFDD